ncbi:MAG TPA: hypothetical protein VGE01_12935, partial [Fimbriimonas sp.]
NAQDYARVVADEPFELFEGNNLIVEQLLRQGLLLAMPMQALCEYGWDGPCPIAASRGIDRRDATEGRPEFAALEDLLHKRDDNG